MCADSQNSIWEGVYSSFDEAPETPSVFNAELWTSKQQQRVLEKLSLLHNGKEISELANSKDYPLATMISLLSRRSNLRVLDYGGAMGQSYLDLLAKVPGVSDRVQYTVLEMPAVVDAVPPQIKQLKNLDFISSLEQAGQSYDLIHIGSTMQYFDDWQKILTNLQKQYRPEIFVLSDLLVGDIPSFVTIQKYYETSIKVRFINIMDFLEFWRSSDYDLIYKTYYNPLEDGKYFPNQALPKEYRIDKACHLVFSLKSGA